MSKISVMIVDDEKLAVEDLISIFDWEANGFEIIATVFNGKQALAKFKEINPQIIITDIKMPFMDGIELVQNVRKLNAKTKILLLTAYSDFGYAQHAIQLGITDYMIKGEINHQTLKEKLLWLKDLIDSETKTSFMLTQKVISDFFNSDVESNIEESILDVSKELLNTPYFYFIIEKDMPLDISGDNFSDSEKHYENEMISCCTSIDEKENSFVSVSAIRRNQVLLLINNRKSFSQNEMRSTMLQIAAKLKQVLNDYFQSEFTIYIVSYMLNLFEMKNLYTTLNRRLFAKYLLGNGKIYDLSDEKLNWTKKEISFDDSLLVKLVEDMDNDEAQKYIDASFAQVLPPNKDYAGLVFISRSLYKILKKYIDVLPGFASEPDLRGCDNWTQWLNGQDIKKWFKNKFHYLIIEKRKIYENNYSNVVIRAIDFIYEQYSSADFTIGQIADHINLSSGRLSVIFKKETGKTVNDFLTEVRIAKAKILLNQGVLKVYEVSSMVGYGSSQYFSQIFYKLTGLYPNEFRKGEEKK